MTDPGGTDTVRTGAAPPAPAATAEPPSRADLLVQHAEARRRRDAAELGGESFREAAEEVARIEVAIALAEEPPIAERADAAGER